MHPRTAPHDAGAPLRVEVIDDRGQVLDTVYIAEITGGPGPNADATQRTDPTPIPRGR